SVSDEDGSLLRSGEPLEQVVDVATQHGASALLVNCTIPETVTKSMEILAKQSLPIGAYANGFTGITEAFKKDNATVDALEARKDLDPQAYLAFAQQWRDSGAEIIGGCCEVGPAHIAALAESLT
ncbi:MAG: homocysteine S-methyltransferase family protein, partial [Pseudomonadota bacterium]